ncbi:MAG: hypothetical protein V3S14_00185 [Anaerolineae bacterium]
MIDDQALKPILSSLYYTPSYSVDYIMRQTVGKLVAGQTPRQISKLRIEQHIPCQPERPEAPPASGKVASRPVLSGLHHAYFWQAAESVGRGK